MTAPRMINKDLLEAAEKVLQDKFTDDLKISSAEKLSDEWRRNVILRLHIEGTSSSIPRSVILKQSLPQGVNEDEDKKAFSRFSRDWAGLEFANRVSKDKHNTPIFYGSNQKLRFILIEDLGDPHVSLVDTLTRDNPREARESLERYVTALASFHATGFQHTQEYLEILRKINPDADMPKKELDLTAKDLKERLNLILTNDKIGLTTTKEFLNEVDQILDGVFIPGPFTVLTHGDMAPDNVFDHPTGLQIIDFELCAPRNALLDGTYLRMCIPTGWCAKSIPEEILISLEKMYRAELAKGIPNALNDKLYYEAYVQACGFHALQQMAAVIACLDENRTWSPPGVKGPLPLGSLWDEDTNFLRPRCISRLQTFVEQAETHNMYPHARKMAIDMLDKFKKIWSDAKPLDSYPAFKHPELENTNTRTNDSNFLQEQTKK